MDDLLALCVLLGYLDRGDGVVDGVLELEAKLGGVLVEQYANALAGGEHADDDTRVGMTLDVVEYHRGALLRRAHDGAARADVAVNAGYLSLRISLDVRLDELTGVLLERFDCGSQIVYFSHYLFLAF